jgi:hypothetical protein
MRISEQRMQELIEKYRHINVEDEDFGYCWWEGTYTDFTYDMDVIGIEVSDMYFSGFSSQGDGACFQGSVWDWSKFLNKVMASPAQWQEPVEVSEVLILHATEYFSFSVKHSGYYYHENCTCFSADLPLPFGEEFSWFSEKYAKHPEEDFRTMVWHNILSGYFSDQLEEDFTDFFKDCMRELYSRLEFEYGYLTSDEAVWETIVANGLDTPEEEEQ